MNKFLPVLVVSALGCGAGLEVVDVALSDLPRPSLRVERETDAGGERTSILPEQDDFHGPCHRLPAQTLLSANGRALTMKSLGGAAVISSGYGSGHPSCVTPHFTGNTFPDEPRTEFLLSDDKTSRRAVFQALRAPRHFRVNGQEQATVRAGEELDLEWFPATDLLDGLEVSLRAEGSTALIQMSSYRREGPHLYVTFAPAPAGRYVLTATGGVKAGVETCEGFSTCEAPLVLPQEQPVSAPLTVEAP